MNRAARKPATDATFLGGVKGRRCDGTWSGTGVIWRGSGPVGPVAEADPDGWWRCVEVHLRGPLLCSRAVLPGMLARRKGRIVNVASGAGTRAIPDLSAYVVSKAALIRLTENLADEVR